jgi:anti-sigma factor RsiW
MNCSSVDVKAYFLGEASRAEKSSVEDHVRVCESCREELDRLKITDAALRSLPDEEAPQRIAFVSDKVFEPRWYQTIWHSGPAMGFASAAILAVAILVHGFSVNGVTRPLVTAKVDTAQIEQRIEQSVKARLDAAEARHSQEMATILNAAEKRFEAKRKEDLAVALQAARYYDQQMARFMTAANDRAGQ